jgi:hypothetical protein
MFTVIERVEMVEAQQLGHRRAPILSLWLPSLMEAFFRGSHPSNFVTCGFSKSYNQAAEVPSSKREVQVPAQPIDKLQNHAAFRRDHAFHHDLSAPFITAIEILSLCTSMPIYFLLSIEGVPFCRD